MFAFQFYWMFHLLFTYWSNNKAFCANRCDFFYSYLISLNECVCVIISLLLGILNNGDICLSIQIGLKWLKLSSFLFNISSYRHFVNPWKQRMLRNIKNILIFWKQWNLLKVWMWFIWPSFLLSFFVSLVSLFKLIFWMKLCYFFLLFTQIQKKKKKKKTNLYWKNSLKIFPFICISFKKRKSSFPIYLPSVIPNSNHSQCRQT